MLEYEDLEPANVGELDPVLLGGPAELAGGLPFTVASTVTDGPEPLPNI